VTENAKIELITFSQAASVLGCHYQQVKRLVEREWFPTVEQNGELMIVREGLEQRWRDRPRLRNRPLVAPPGAREAKGGADKPPAPTAKRGRPRKAPADPGEDRPPERQHRPMPERGVDERGEAPDWNVERSWTEYERNRGLMMDNLIKEGKLVYRQDMEIAYNAVLSQMLTRGHSAAKQIKLQIPHLTPEEIGIIETIILDIFQQTAEHNYEELSE